MSCDRCDGLITTHSGNPDEAFLVSLYGGYGMAEDGEVRGYLCESCVKDLKAWLGQGKFQIRYFPEKGTHPWPEWKH